ncbi:MAG: dihydroneopterin aldolase [Rhodobacteraceae bacterium]|nr:dihydroneopterin aldolase [Paracoccaceae bacterium]
MDDTAIAFESPTARSLATSKDPLDRISVRDYEREVEIGAFQSERGVQQRIRFNVVLEVSRHNAAQDDDVDKVISYDTITEAIELQLSTERINLLETLAERVAERVLEDPRAVRVFVRIEKLDRIPGTLGVEIVRSQKDMAAPLRSVDPVEVVDATPHPRVVFMANSVLHSAELPAWLDAIAEQDVPAIICVERGDLAVPQADIAMPQRRIDLLAMEQNAWVLAGKDKRCVVVDSRTELDWAMKHGQLSVWAPSRIVLDAVEPPETLAPVELAMWLAGEFSACELVLIGVGEIPESKTILVSAPRSAAQLNVKG